jgi:gp6-like head-tail connector protein
MADWPDLDELKQKLDVNGSEWDDHLDRLLTAAIAQVQYDVGEDVDEPDASLAHAALLLAVSVGSTEGEPDVSAAARLPKYQRLLKGHRVRFGVA